ncbi:unnamed protein product, partial [Rangifer tarandus platyrhynchus]
PSSRVSLRMHVTRYSLGCGLLCYMSATWNIPGDCEWFTRTRFTVKALAAAILGLHWSNVMVLCSMRLR